VSIDPKRLHELSAIEILDAGFSADVRNRPFRAYVDRRNGVCVQVYQDTYGCRGTPWEGTLRVAVKHTSGKTPQQAASRGYSKPITWDDLQAIKDHLWPERIALEIYPPHDSIVDVADIRWLWVLPAGGMLPFNLQSSSPERLTSEALT
jgi:hypothetical protein